MGIMNYLSPVAAVGKTGFGRSLIDSFTGKGAQRQLDRGIAEVGAGRTAGIDAIRSGGAEARGYMGPWLDRGGRRMYDATLGLSGDAARTAAQDTYFSDDVLQRQLALQQKQRGWSSNARGGYGSGADALAASRVNLQNYGAWQNRLAGVADQEYDAAGRTASIAAGEGRDIAGVHTGASNALAGLYGQSAQNANTPFQNLIGIGGVAARLFGGGGGGGNRIG